MDKLGYTMMLETKIIKRKHLVKFCVGMTVEDFIETLEYVPEGATIKDVDEGTGDGTCSIEFHEEELDASTK